MTFLSVIDLIGPVAFLGFMCGLGVTVLLTSGALLLFFDMPDVYIQLDKKVKKAGYYGVLTIALCYIVASMALWMALHILIRSGLVH